MISVNDLSVMSISSHDYIVSSLLYLNEELKISFENEQQNSPNAKLQVGSSHVLCAGSSFGLKCHWHHRFFWDLLFQNHLTPIQWSMLSLNDISDLKEYH